MLWLLCISVWFAQAAFGRNSTNGDCPHGWSHFQNHCYKQALVVLGRNWMDSSEYCWAVLGGSALVSVHSPAEQDFITRFKAPLGTPQWIGLRDVTPFADGHTWSWSDNSEISDFSESWPWSDGHPWDQGCECVYTRGDNFKWECQRCDTPCLSFVCKLGLGKTTEMPILNTTFIPTEINVTTTSPNVTTPANTTQTPNITTTPIPQPHNNKSNSLPDKDVALIVLFIILGIIIAATLVIYLKYFRKRVDQSYQLFAPQKTGYEMRHSQGPRKSYASTSTGYVPPEVNTFTENGTYLHSTGSIPPVKSISNPDSDDGYLESISVPRQHQLSINGRNEF